jgi:hypothetical protein
MKAVPKSIEPLGARKLMGPVLRTLPKRKLVLVATAGGMSLN